MVNFHNGEEPIFWAEKRELRSNTASGQTSISAKQRRILVKSLICMQKTGFLHGVFSAPETVAEGQCPGATNYRRSDANTGEDNEARAN